MQSVCSTECVRCSALFLVVFFSGFLGYESEDQFPKLHLSAELGKSSGSVCMYESRQLGVFLSGLTDEQGQGQPPIFHLPCFAGNVSNTLTQGAILLWGLRPLWVRNYTYSLSCGCAVSFGSLPTQHCTHKSAQPVVHKAKKCLLGTRKAVAQFTQLCTAGKTRDCASAFITWLLLCYLDNIHHSCIGFCTMCSLLSSSQPAMQARL